MSKSVHDIKIPVSVELGNPASDCAHFGICSVAVLSPKQWGAFKSRHVRHVKAMLSVSTTGSLRFEFPLESMRADTRAQFFPPEGFRVDSAGTMPRVIVRLLHLSPSACTVPGVYGLSVERDGLVMELTISAPKPALVLMPELP